MYPQKHIMATTAGILIRDPVEETDWDLTARTVVSLCEQAIKEKGNYSIRLHITQALSEEQKQDMAEREDTSRLYGQHLIPNENPQVIVDELYSQAAHCSKLKSRVSALESRLQQIQGWLEDELRDTHHSLVACLAESTQFENGNFQGKIEAYKETTDYLKQHLLDICDVD